MGRTICIDCGQLNAAADRECRSCGGSRLAVTDDSGAAHAGAWAGPTEPTVAWDRVPRAVAHAGAPAAAAPPMWAALQDAPTSAWSTADARVYTADLSDTPDWKRWAFGAAAGLGILFAGFSGFWFGKGSHAKEAASVTVRALPSARAAAMPAPLPPPPESYAAMPVSGSSATYPTASASVTQLSTYHQPGVPSREHVPQPVPAMVADYPARAAAPRPEQMARAEAPLPPPNLVYRAAPRMPAQVVMIVESNGIVRFAQP